MKFYGFVLNGTPMVRTVQGEVIPLSNMAMSELNTNYSQLVRMGTGRSVTLNDRLSIRKSLTSIRKRKAALRLK